jgi:MSHA biogenesis protein MshP
MKKLQKGFSIVSAIFLLVVLAFLGTAMVTFSVNQQQSAAMDVMGSRAYQAARAGVEWGAYKVLQGGGACAATTTLPAGTLLGTLGGFTVVVTCSATAASDMSTQTGTVTVYYLTSTATQGGAPGSPDYVERMIQVTIAK